MQKHGIFDKKFNRTVNRHLKERKDGFIGTLLAGIAG